jgi:hypothetical protein
MALAETITRAAAMGQRAGRHLTDTGIPTRNPFDGNPALADLAEAWRREYLNACATPPGRGALPTISSRADILAALKTYTTTGNPAALRQHITRRAVALGASNLLPPTWQG